MAKKDSVLKKQLNVKAAKYPTKREINLAVIGQQEVNWGKTIPIIIVIVVALCLFAKFGILDVMSKLDGIRTENTAINQRIDEYEAIIEELKSVNDEYAHYTYEDLTDEENNRVSRVDAVNLLEKYVLSKTDIDTWSVSGNILLLTMHDIELDEANKITAALEGDELVSFCTLTTAGNSSDGDESVVKASVTIYLNGPVDLNGGEQS